MEFHEDILTDVQRSMLRRVGPIAEGLGFYLAGGTAVALRLGHRRSDDFDWFSDNPVRPIDQLGAELEVKGLSVSVSSVARGTFHGTMDGVRITFLEYRYPLLRTADIWAAYGCRIASLEDLAAMKLSTIVQRGSRKDFVDIHEILFRSSCGLAFPDLPFSRKGERAGAGETSHSARFNSLLSLYRRKFSVRNVAPVLHALAYFDDAENEPMLRMRRPVKWESIKKDLSRRLKHFRP